MFPKILISAFTILIFLGFTISLHSQIGATLSSNMLVTYDASTIPENTIQLEPTFNHKRSLGYYDNHGDFINTTGATIFSNLFYRASYGLTKNLEIGAGINNQLTQLNLAAKYHLIGNERFGLAILSGVNSDITTGVRLLSSLDKQFIIGLTNQFQINKDLSFNLSLQLQDERTYEGLDLFLNYELAYAISNSISLIGGLGYNHYSNSNLMSSRLFSLFPGFVIEKNNFNIVFQGLFDLAGKNAISSTGFSFAITQSLD